MGRKSLPAKGPRNRPGESAVETVQPLGLGRLWPVWGVLAACVWIAFAPVRANGFVDWDDQQWILENHAFRGLGWEQIRFAFTTFTGGVYQPLGWLLQSLTFAFFGLDPRGYHLVGLLLHVVNVILLHFVCVKLAARSIPEAAARLGSAFGWLCGVPVLMYAVHPLRVEPVAWASCQAYLAGATFALLATLAYLRAHPLGEAFRRSWMIGSSVLVVLAVLTKGSAVVTPFVFLILDAYPLGRLGTGRPSWRSLRMVLIEKVPLLAFCLVFTGVAFAAKGYGVDPEESVQPVIVARSAQACFGAWFYLVKTVWPVGITAYYPRPEGGDFLSPVFAACASGVVVAAASALLWRRRRPWFSAALAAYLVIAAPYLGLARVGVTLAADRYSYTPTMVLVVLGCVGIARPAALRWSPRARAGAAAGTCAVAAGLMGLCAAQCRVWESSEHLWSQALAHAPWSSELHHLTGSSLADQGKLDRAAAELHEALRIRPHYAGALYDLGVLLDRRGETEQAVAYLREAASLRPKDAMVYLSLGGALVNQGRFDEAVALYREGLRLEPGFPNLHFNLGAALLRQKKTDAGVEELALAVKLRPWYTDARAALGGAFALQGRLSEAEVQYREALRLDPDHSASRINRGLILARLGRFPEATAQLREAVRRDGLNPETHHVLGSILVRMGRTREAAGEFEEVLRLRPDHAPARAFLAMARGGRM